MLVRRTTSPIAAVLIALCISSLAARPGMAGAHMPAQLGDREFWNLIEGLSEPNGFFHSDNLVSNEGGYQLVIDQLVQRTRPIDTYVGVGPEQNFTYIAALKPQAAFIVDIRRGNLQLHLLYKALFELSADRATFVSRLFGRSVAGVRPDATARDLFSALDAASPDGTRLDDDFLAIRDHLTRTRQLPLAKDDLDAIRGLLRQFHAFGPSITYLSPRVAADMPTYADLMQSTDGTSQRSFLSNEERFASVKDLHQRNLIVPVVGNLAGDKTLRAIGAYVHAHDATIGAMYVSNVEEYLIRDRTWGGFCRNVAAMPLDARSTFIRAAEHFGSEGSGVRLKSSLGSMAVESSICSPKAR